MNKYQVKALECFVKYSIIIGSLHPSFSKNKTESNMPIMKGGCYTGRLFPPRTHIYCTQEFLRITGNFNEHFQNVIGFEITAGIQLKWSI